MRHNQNARRGSRGRSGGGGHHHSGGNTHSSHHNNNPGRRVNPRVQVFDSNGPEVRIRGTAYQINEKYVTLARDATAAGDRVLGESYLQHAEHYQRFINEMSEEFGQQPFNNPQGQQQQQPHVSHFPQTEELQNGAPAVSQPDGEANGHDANGSAIPASAEEQQQPRQERRHQRHGGNQRSNVGAAAVATPADEPDAG